MKFVGDRLLCFIVILTGSALSSIFSIPSRKHHAGVSRDAFFIRALITPAVDFSIRARVVSWTLREGYTRIYLGQTTVSRLTSLEPQSRLGGHLLEISLVCLQNGTAVLKGGKYLDRSTCSYCRYILDLLHMNYSSSSLYVTGRDPIPCMVWHMFSWVDYPLLSFCTTTSHNVRGVTRRPPELYHRGWTTFYPHHIPRCY